MVASVADGDNYGALGALKRISKGEAGEGRFRTPTCPLFFPISIFSLATHGVLCLPLDAALSHIVARRPCADLPPTLSHRLPLSTLQTNTSSPLVA